MKFNKAITCLGFILMTACLQAQQIEELENKTAGITMADNDNIYSASASNYAGAAAGAYNKNGDTLNINLLKAALKGVKNYLAKNDLSFAASTLGGAKETLKQIIKDYPTLDVSGYEKQIADLEKAIGSKGDAQESKDEAIGFIKNKANSCGFLIPNTYSSGMYNQSKQAAESFYEKCQKLDYPASKKKMDELLVKYPDLKEANQTRNDIDKFYNSFSTEFTEFSGFLIREANAAIENAYANKKNNQILAATGNAEAAIVVAKCILAVFPDHAGGLKVKAEAEKIAGSADRAMSSKYTSDYHKQNAGHLIFSKNEIVLKKENAATAASSFTLKDHLYGMAYLKGTIKELTEGGSSAAGQVVMQISIFIDGNEMTTSSFKYPMTKEMETPTAFAFEILPDPATAKDCAGAVKYAKLFALASPREHEIKFRFSAIYLSARHDLAEGTFNLDLSDGQEVLDKLAILYRKTAIKNVFMPKAATSNPGLEKDMISAAGTMLRTMGWEGTAIKAVITETQWQTYRYPLTGMIEDRKINGSVAVKLTNGECRLYRITFKQYFGNNSIWQKVQTYSSDNGTDMDCGNAGVK